MLSRAASLGFVSHRAEARRVPGDLEAGTCLCPTSATFMGLLPFDSCPSAGCVECKLLSRIDFLSRLGCACSGDRLVKNPELHFRADFGGRRRRCELPRGTGPRRPEAFRAGVPCIAHSRLSGRGVPKSSQVSRPNLAEIPSQLPSCPDLVVLN